MSTKIKTYKLLLISIFLILMGQVANAFETVSITGKVNDAFDSEPLPEVSVAAIQLPDSVVTSLVMTDKEGRFEIRMNREKEFLRFEKNGWKTVCVDSLTSHIDLVLQREGTDLPEFTISATRANMKGKPGMFVYSPGDLVKHVKNAREVLDYVPLLESPTKIFSKKGLAVIYINGEEQMMDQELLLQKLKALPADKIKRVELIMNPGAEYEGSEHEGGIVNIILEDDLYGWNVFANLGTRYGGRRFYNYTPYVAWYYQNHNLLLSVYLNDNYLDHFDSSSQILTDKDTGLLRKYNDETNGSGNQLATGVTAEYKFGKSSIGASVTLSTWHDKRNHVAEEEQYIDESHLNDNIYSGSSISRSSYHTPLSLIPVLGVRFRHSFNKSLRLNISALLGMDKITQHNIMDVYAGEHPEDIIRSLDQSNQKKGFGTGVDIQLLKRFVDGSQLTGRAQLHYDHTEIRYTSLDDRYMFDNGQWAEAFTLNYNKQWSGLFSSRIGLREEYVNRKITGGESSKEYRNGFLLWLPNVSLSFNLRGGLHSIDFDWATIPLYPATEQLNPHKTWTDNTTYSQGNPEMEITTKHSFSINYAFLNDYFISCSYQKGKVANDDYIYLDEAGNLVYSYIMNKRYNDFELNLRYSRNFFEYRWSVYASGWLTWKNSNARLHDVYFSNHSLDYMTRLNTRVVISRRYGFNADASYTWHSGTKSLTYESNSTHTLSFSLKKDLWRNAEISASVSIPLNSTYGTYVNASSLSNEYTKKYNRDISGSINFSWFFGKLSIERVDNITTH